MLANVIAVQMPVPVGSAEPSTSCVSSSVPGDPDESLYSRTRSESDGDPTARTFSSIVATVHEPLLGSVNAWYIRCP